MIIIDGAKYQVDREKYTVESLQGEFNYLFDHRALTVAISQYFALHGHTKTSTILRDGFGIREFLEEGQLNKVTDYISKCKEELNKIKNLKSRLYYYIAVILKELIINKIHPLNS